MRDVYVDNTAPDPVAPQVVGRRRVATDQPFRDSWTNPADHAAPIVRAHWKLCASDGSCPSRGQHDGANIQELPSLKVPAPGEYQLHVWLEDAAGNAREESAAISAALRFDPEPPQLAFEPTDITDPLRVVVNAVDRHSGVADGEIEMRAAGTSTWHGLATERQGSLLVAHVDDERFRRGAYEFRAHAVDQAGNEASTGRRTDGSAATLRLPARIDTRLAVGVPRMIVRRKVERHRGHRRVIRRRIRRLDSSVVARARRARSPQRLPRQPLTGQPIDGATIEALEKRPEGALTPVGVATTGTDGKFHYVVKATRNREMLFRYGGSRRIGSQRRLTSRCSCPPTRRSARTDGVCSTDNRCSSGAASLTRPLPTQRKARRDAGPLPRPLANFLHSSRGPQRPLALPVPLRRHGRARDLPIPRSAPCRRRLSVHQRQFTRRRGGRTGG